MNAPRHAPPPKSSPRADIWFALTKAALKNGNKPVFRWNPPRPPARTQPAPWTKPPAFPAYRRQATENKGNLPAANRVLRAVVNPMNTVLSAALLMGVLAGSAAALEKSSRTDVPQISSTTIAASAVISPGDYVVTITPDFNGDMAKRLEDAEIGRASCR